MKIILVGLSIVLFFLTGILVERNVFELLPAKIVYVQVGDVPDLIRRLKPVTRERYRYTLGTDVSVCFEGDVAVSLKLHMKNDNEYISKARTLREAVAGLSSPSEDIKHALEGW